MRRLALTIWMGATACAGGSGATEDAGTSRGSTAAADTAAESGSTSSADGSSSGGGMFTAAAMSSEGTTTTMTGGGSAMLVYPGGNPLEIPFEDLGGTRIVATEVLNVGTATATAMAGELVGPFDFTGDGYPGDLGNCTDTLEVGEMCLIHVAFTPVALGPVMGEVNLSYEDGSRPVATLVLLAEGRGTTANLVQGGDAERCADGSAPPGWDQGAVEHWACSGAADGVTPNGGTSMLRVSLADDAAFEMTHRIDFEPHTPAIAEGEVTASLSLWTQTLDDDTYEVELHYLDADRTVVESFEPAAATAMVWTETTDTRSVPSDAVAAELTVRCVPTTGDCDLYVDDVALTLTR